MRAADWLAAADALPVGTIRDLAPEGGLLVVAPHPDDESLGCGGALALAARAGIRTGVVVLSDGSGSHPGSRDWPAERLSALREDEARRACATLGVRADDVRFLRLPDRAVPSSGPAFEAAARTIAAAADAIGAGTLLAPFGGDPHCDHEAGAAIAAHAAALSRTAGARMRLFAYPLWAYALPADAPLSAAPPRGIGLDVTDVLEVKARAIDAHASQLGLIIADDPGGFAIPAWMRAHALSGREPFVEVAS
ncbi:PIG-L deacetylase family protein [Salinarimonas ramus]|uniref:LmbE family N-acetylglucosaminyl deacetylase n=1 Tax=Salinarimonas ramus TaxID=690164 RepID=A0A917QB10_9HYPH|nr:PIG-L family deacetylase [Salinarimonas ramus]GGK39431.1 hypothetical protein GCM10011322_28190 [Salinarimonas ramus]